MEIIVLIFGGFILVCCEVVGFNEFIVGFWRGHSEKPTRQITATKNSNGFCLIDGISPQAFHCNGFRAANHSTPPSTELQAPLAPRLLLAQSTWK